MKKAFKRGLSVVLAIIMLIPTGIMTVFAQSSNASSADTETEVAYESTNSVGAMILDYTQEEICESIEYSIQSVDIEGKYAWVEFINLDACTIVVAIYDENGETMLGSGKEKIETKESAVNDAITVTIEIDEMPEYFLVKAFIIDENNEPLCHNYETKEYTQAFEEFLAKTTDNFDSDMVINLDESEDNNFLVVSDDAIVIEAQDGVNTVTTDDYKNGVYVIENADSQIKNLQPGDMFYYQYGESEDVYILATVGSINVDGDTVTVNAAETGDLTDYFDYVKIDFESSTTTFDDSDMDEDVIHETVEVASRTRDNINIDGSASVSDKWTIDKTFDDSIKLSASITIKASMSLKIYVYEEIDYAYVEAVIKYSGKITVSLSGEIEFPPIPLGCIGFDTEKLGVVAAIKFDFVVEGKAAVTLTFTLEEGAVGFAYSSDIGLIDKRKAPTTDFTPELKGELTIFIGLSITPQIEATKYMEISLEAKAGLELKGTIPEPSSEEQHSCSVCIDGEAAFKLEATASVRFFDWIENEWTLIEIDDKLGNFYVSFDNGWNFGTCPHRAYKVTVAVYDKTTGDPVKDVTVNSEYTPDDSGKTVFYLKNGTHTVAVEYSGTQIYSNEIVILDTGKEIDISYDFTSFDDSDVDATRVVTANGTCGDNLTWTLYEDGELVIDGIGAMTNYTSSASGPWYSYGANIKSVTIGNSVTTIGKYAFCDCDSITNVTIGDSVTTIGARAFFCCTSLTSVTIPDSVTSIGTFAFYKCALKSIEIPKSVAAINSAFELCNKIEYITVDENNQYYSSDECGVLFNKNKTELIQYPTGNSRTEYIIPDSVTTIGDNSFEYCDSLTSITIPDSVTTIDVSAFYDCDSLTSVTIPDSVTTIGDYAFKSCDSLTNITIPDSVTTLESEVFKYTAYYNDESNWENKVLYINNHLIKAKDTITGDYKIKQGTITIAVAAFEDCDNLTSIIIPDSITKIGRYTFSLCDSLTSVTIPDSVTTIGISAFYDCYSLTNITIGNNVTSISSYAFYGCNSLTTVYYSGTKAEWNSISKSWDNDCLTNANIICSDTVSTASVMALSLDDEIETYSESTVMSETITSAVVCNDYLIIVVKDKNAEDLLAPENLIFIDQKTAESETLTFDFDLGGETEYFVIVTNAKLPHYHDYCATSVTAPTCTKQGYTTYTCYCGDSYVGAYVDSLGHTEETIAGYDASCTELGLTDGVKCSVCQTVLTQQEIIPAHGHVNENSDKLCDECGYDFTSDCSHICHSSNSFVSFFWKIVLFFSKIFNIQSNRYCDCGVAHW